MAPTLYMIEISPSSRAVLMTASCLGIKLEKHYVDITAGENRTEEFSRLNPQCTVPTLVEEDGRVLWDGHAIIYYLVNKYGKNSLLYPDDIYTRALIHQRLHFDNEYLFAPSSQIAKNLFNGNNYADSALLEKIRNSYNILEKMLEGHLWAVGDEVTIADFSMIATASTIDLFMPVNAKTYPNVADWLQRARTQSWYKENVNGLAISKKTFEKYNFRLTVSNGTV